MVPLRFVAQALGGTVNWDGSTNTANINSTASTNRIYINQKAKFSLDLPASWDGHYKVSEDVDGRDGSALTVYFDYIPKEGKEPVGIFSIVVYPKDFWINQISNQKPDEKPFGGDGEKVIAETDESVYVYMPRVDEPFYDDAMQSEDAKMFYRLDSDLKLDKSFSLIK